MKKWLGGAAPQIFHASVEAGEKSTGRAVAIAAPRRNLLSCKRGGGMNEKSDNQKPITGWVAWHPEHGDLGVESSEVDAWESAKLSVFNSLPLNVRTKVLRGDYIDIRKFIRGIDIEGSGWRIRPVELRFTDTEDK